MPVFTTGIFLFCTKQKCYYEAFVASHSCAVGNPMQQMKNHFAVINGKERKVNIDLRSPTGGQGPVIKKSRLLAGF
jgi:hypothetical protein